MIGAAPPAIRAGIERERRRIAAAAAGAHAPRELSLADRYALEPIAYIREKLGWTPWRGTPEAPGQVEVLEEYALAIRKQLERHEFEQGRVTEDQLHCWRPGEVIKNRIRVEAGHTVGKTKLASGIVSHFFDCFVPSTGYAFAPSAPQINDLLFKEIRADREGKALPGRVLPASPEMKRSPRHFVKGRATNDDKGKGTERVQGQHERFMIFVLDEAEGIADFVWDALDSMISGGIVVIVIMLANPRTRTSKFHKARALPTVRTFRISCLHHPNVLQDREVVPGGVRRDYVEAMVDKACDVVQAHDPDEDTFELPFPVRTKHGVMPVGTIFRPAPDFLFRVMGRAPANLADNTFVPVGRYEAATKRPRVSHDPTMGRLGIDVARFGRDHGTVWVRHDGAIWRAARLSRKDTNEYARAAKAAALELAKRGVQRLSIRVDGGGGFGGGVIDKLKIDMELIQAFQEFVVLEVHNNGEPHDPTAYADLGTEMYAEAAETIRGITIVDPPETLEADLCERTFDWMNRSGRDVRKLQEKKKFRDHVGRSPDDGDGFVLAAAPEFLFQGRSLPFIPSTSSVTV